MSYTICTLLLLFLPKRGTFLVLTNTTPSFFSSATAFLCCNNSTLFFLRLSQILCPLPFPSHTTLPPLNYTPATLQLFLQSVLRRYLILLGCEVILPCYLQFIVPFKDTCGLQLSQLLYQPRQHLLRKFPYLHFDQRKSLLNFKQFGTDQNNNEKKNHFQGDQQIYIFCRHMKSLKPIKSNFLKALEQYFIEKIFSLSAAITSYIIVPITVTIISQKLLSYR